MVDTPRCTCGANAWGPPHLPGCASGAPALVEKSRQSGQAARAICDALGFDPTNHHNAFRCPYCMTAFPTDNQVLVAAKAICAADDLDWEAQTDPMTSGSGSDAEQQGYLDKARAALETLVVR